MFFDLVVDAISVFTPEEWNVYRSNELKFCTPLGVPCLSAFEFEPSIGVRSHCLSHSNQACASVFFGLVAPNIALLKSAVIPIVRTPYTCHSSGVKTKTKHEAPSFKLPHELAISVLWICVDLSLNLWILARALYHNCRDVLLLNQLVECRHISLQDLRKLL